jgi:hypothetical protein
MDFRGLHDIIPVANNVFFTVLSPGGGAALVLRIHVEDMLGFRTSISARGTTGPRDESPNLVGRAYEQGTKRRKAAENENEPAFHQAPEDQIEYTI